jgi:hypothetical protein
MTADETKTVLKLLRVAYPNFYRNITAKEANDIIDVWAVMFEDEPLPLVLEAVKATIATKKDFPPDIATIKEKIQLITQPCEMTEIEAWNIVKKAVSVYNTQENFERLPETLQKLVGSPSQLREWGLMDSETFGSVVQSNFMRSYKARIQQKKQLQALPESTKKMIKMLSNNLKMIEGG